MMHGQKNIKLWRPGDSFL